MVGIEGFPLPWPFRGEGGSRSYRGAALGGYLCPGPFGGREVSGVIGGIVFYLGFGTSSYIHSAQDSQICSSHRPRSTSVSLLYTVYTYLIGAIFLLWSPIIFYGIGPLPISITLRFCAIALWLLAFLWDAYGTPMGRLWDGLWEGEGNPSLRCKSDRSSS